MSERLDSQGGQPRQPDVVRECLGWGAFATVIVPAVLILTGTGITTAALGAGAVAAVTASIFVVVRMTGLSLPRLGTSAAADAPAPAQPEPPGPGWTPDAVEAKQLYPAPEQTRPPAPVGQDWREPSDTDWNDQPMWIPDGPPQTWERIEQHDAAASVPHSGDLPSQPPWFPSAEPTSPALGAYPRTEDEPLPWEHDRGFAEVDQPPEPRLSEPRLDQSELHRAEQRGRHRRGP